MTAIANNTKSTAEIKTNFKHSFFKNALVEDGMVKVGLDLSAHHYQICFLNKDQKQRNFNLSRERFEKCLQEAGVKLYIAFEACSGASFWKLYIESLGHKVRLVPTNYTAGARGYKANKSDAIDAEVLRESLYIAGFKEGKVRSLEELCLRKAFQTIDGINKAVAAEVNRVRSLFIEIGYPYHNINTVDDCLNAIDSFQAYASTHSTSYIDTVSVLCEEVQEALMLYVKRKSRLIEKVIENHCDDDICCTLMKSVPGINSYLAVLLKTNISTIDRFDNSRDLVAYLGFTPAHNGTGGKVHMGKLSRNGDYILKGALYEAALSLMHQGRGKHGLNGPRSEYIHDMMDRYSSKFKKSVIKICIKLIKVIFGVLKKQESYSPQVNNDLGDVKKRTVKHSSPKLLKRWDTEGNYIRKSLKLTLVEESTAHSDGEQTSPSPSGSEQRSQSLNSSRVDYENIQFRNTDFAALWEFMGKEERVAAHNKQSREQVLKQKRHQRSQNALEAFIQKKRAEKYNSTEF